MNLSPAQISALQLLRLAPLVPIRAGYRWAIDAAAQPVHFITLYSLARRGYVSFVRQGRSRPRLARLTKAGAYRVSKVPA